jgi:hypothetical protein
MNNTLNRRRNIKSNLSTSETYPLHIAVARNDLYMLKQLIKSGEDVNCVGGLGDTPLILATKKGHTDAAKILIEANANINAVDRYKQSALYYTVTKFYNSSPNVKKENFSDLAALLIKKGANHTPIRVDSEYFIKTLRCLALNHHKMAEDFIKNQFHLEMYRTNNDYIKESFSEFLSTSDRKEGLKSTLDKLINVDFRYENKVEAITHLAHLHSWRGEVIDFDYQIEAEGWLMHRYPPLKIKSLLNSARDINDGKINCEKTFNEPKIVVLSKIISEIESQLTTYYTQINQDTLKVIDNPKLKDFALNEEINMICKKIKDLKPGKEFAIASGFPGHAIYIGFKKNKDNTVERIVYNLGAGITGNHVFSPTGRIYPDVIKDINVSNFQTPSSSGGKYIKGIIEAKLGIHKNYLEFIYNNSKMLNGSRVTKEFIYPAQKRQLAGNCVLKNNNTAIRNRLRNDNLFKWLKNEEIKVAEKIADIGHVEIKNKEGIKDILSLNYIINEYKRSKDLKSAVVNFNLFFRKRLDYKPSNKSPYNEFVDFISNNKNNKNLVNWLKVEGIQKLVDSINSTHKLSVPARKDLRKKETKKKLRKQMLL